MKSPKESNVIPIYQEVPFTELEPGEIYHATGAIPKYRTRGRSTVHRLSLYDLRHLNAVRADKRASDKAKSAGLPLYVLPGPGQNKQNQELISLAYRSERREPIRHLIKCLFLIPPSSHVIKLTSTTGAYTKSLLHVEVNFNAHLSGNRIKQHLVKTKEGQKWLGINPKTIRILSRILAAESEETTIDLLPDDVLASGNWYSQQYWLTTLIACYAGVLNE